MERPLNIPLTSLSLKLRVTFTSLPKSSKPGPSFLQPKFYQPKWMDLRNKDGKKTELVFWRRNISLVKKSRYLVAGKSQPLVLNSSMEAQQKRIKNYINRSGNNFHFRCGYFGAIRYLLAESGYPEVFITSDVIGSGSVAGFLQGIHVNHCVRVHPMLFAPLSELHLQQFHRGIYGDEQLPEVVKSQLSNISEVQY